MTQKLLFAWLVFSICSLFLFAFADIQFWAPLSGADGGVRFSILCIFHAAGCMAYPIVRWST